MHNNIDADFLQAVEKCKIYVNEKCFTDVEFTKKNKTIMINSFFASDIQRNIILQPSTSIVFIQSVVLSTLYAFFKDNLNNENLLSYLLPGDMVVHITEKRRYKVIEINHAEGYLKLQGAKGLTNKLPLTSNFIKPYFGNAKSLDGRGIREKGNNAKGFLASLFNSDKDSIKTTVDESIVVVCSKHDADFLMNGLKLKLEDGKEIRFSELFPCAYYTSSSDWTNYTGNSANVEAILKFSNKISVARELVLEDEFNKIQGVVTYGSEFILAGISELNDILAKKSLHNVTMIAPIYYGDYSIFLTQYPNVTLYAWTNEALLSTINDLNNLFITNGSYEDIINTYQSIDNLCQSNIENNIINSPFDSDLLKKCRESLFKLKTHMRDIEEKESFITCGFSLLNLAEHACFPISKMEELISIKEVNAVSPRNMLNQLESIAHKFSLYREDIYEHMRTVIDSLTTLFGAIWMLNPKGDILRKTLFELINTKCYQVAVIMPKTYYSTIFLSTLNEYEKYKLRKCDFLTPNKYNFKNNYKKVIILSNPEYKRFNALRLPNAACVNFYYYESEYWRLGLAVEKTSRIIDYYDRNNEIEYDYFNDQVVMSDEFEEEREFEKALEEYIDNIFIKTSSESLNKTTQASSTLCEVVKFISFESGEYVFFTKRYHPYRYNPDTGVMEETEVSMIESGDTLAFARIDDENKDIVEKVLNKLIESKKLSEEQERAYYKSRYWKSVLRTYMETNNITYSELSHRMSKMGKTKHEVTLRTWLEEDSRIVGPRDADSFYSIALLTDDKSMLDNPDSYCEACNVVRSMRIYILKFIGKSIIKSVVDKAENVFEQTLYSITEDVSKMIKILQVEKVENISTTIPAYMANRPHNIL